MEAVEKTLTSLRKMVATGTGSHMLLIFHLRPGTVSTDEIDRRKRGGEER